MLPQKMSALCTFLTDNEADLDPGKKRDPFLHAIPRCQAELPWHCHTTVTKHPMKLTRGAKDWLVLK
jgi:hypothetical protein